ncbi:hypothetical protein K435DRAFT_429216, partial [Dendrothele bispora CBS 962.96]
FHTHDINFFIQSQFQSRATYCTPFPLRLSITRNHGSTTSLLRIRTAREGKRLVIKVFRVPNLREHQIKAAENIIPGITTLYDIPTGGGKTLAFWLPLFYHWRPGDTSRESEKVVVVINPLNALMGSQAKDLNDRGITAVALNSESGKPEDLFEVRAIPFLNYSF